MEDYLPIIFILIVACIMFTSLVSDNPDSVKSAAYNAMNNTVTVEEEASTP